MEILHIFHTVTLMNGAYSSEATAGEVRGVSKMLTQD